MKQELRAQIVTRTSLIYDPSDCLLFFYLVNDGIQTKVLIYDV